MITLTVFVEGESDKEWVSSLLPRAFPRPDLDIRIYACEGKYKALRQLNDAEKSEYPVHLAEKTINVALVDADAPNLPDARRELTDRHRLGHLSDRIFFTVPTIEAWLFADIDAAKNIAKKAIPALDRIQFPDEIPNPYFLAREVFGIGPRARMAGRQIIKSMNLERAQSRSPSLREFLAGIAKLLGEDRYQAIPDAEKLIGRRLLGQLINETNPSSRILYKTLAGDRFTAERLADEISQGTPIARQYAADLLRVARELLAREAALDNKNAADGEGNI
ncbi:MAG: DUF4276 family protein [Comamonas sp.]